MSSPIAVPSNFPITWADPEDARLFWQRDRIHYPYPVTPLYFSLDYLTRVGGLAKAWHAYEMPSTWRRQRRVNSYLYQSEVPLIQSPEESAARAKRSQQKLEAAIVQLGETWANEFLPEVKQHLAVWEAFALPSASSAELLAQLEDRLTRSIRLWEIHFRVVLPCYLAISEFDELYLSLFGRKHAFDVYRLLQGFDNQVLETDRMLWQLSRKALATLEVRKLLERGAAVDVLTALAGSESGRMFLAELQAYLAAYGQRGSMLLELGEPSWIEDPTLVIKMLKDYITQPDSTRGHSSRDPLAEMASLAAEREQLLAEVRERLKTQPPASSARFELLLKAAQAATIISEDHNFWIDYRITYHTRRVLLEFGRRLATTGVLDEAAEVFYLTLDELKETWEAQPQPDRKPLVAQRKAEMEHFRNISPPTTLGMTPADLTPPNSIEQAYSKLTGVPVPPDANPNILRGHTGSRGKGLVRGPAKVIRSLHEADKLKKGDVLVAETTAPPWTPLFATVSAIVTDTGGVLSHCAIVAREYRIPAVVGTGNATQKIHDGQRVEVDGSAGVVRLLND